MIINLPGFIEAERPYWIELESLLNQLDADSGFQLNLAQTRRFYYLYQRVSSDLARIVTFSSEPEIRRFLESLTARAYSEMHETRDRSLRFSPWRWLVFDFPNVFRKHLAFFWLSFAAMTIGALFGAGILAVNPDLKKYLIPGQFSHLYQTPSKRVKHEETDRNDRLKDLHATFSTSLMAHNIQISMTVMGLGFSYGIGTLLMLFYNGIILGAIALDYSQAGESLFLLGWLLPHGVFEIPAIIIAGQAGLLLGRAVLGRGDRMTLSARFKAIRSDLSILIFGVAVMLIWAGLVESFFSQYHQPVIPYLLKILFGLIELGLLLWFLSSSGKNRPPSNEP